MDNKDIVREKTFFEVPIHIFTGEILEKDSELVFRKTEDGQKEFIDDLSYVIARFDDEVNENFKKYFRRITQGRGIKNVDEIDINDHDVAALITKAKAKRNGKVGKNEISAIITRVKNLHQPQFMLISFQMMLWAMLYKDMFNIKGKALDSRFEVEIEPSYWDGAKVQESALDKLLSNDMQPPEPFLDKEDPLEIMIAIVTTFINNHKELSDTLQTYIKKAYVGIGMLNSNQTQEDNIFLSEQLDELLS